AILHLHLSPKPPSLGLTIQTTEKYLAPHANAMGVKLETLIEQGLSYPEGGGQPFNLTALALRFSNFNNGVSKLHGEVSNHMWNHIFPDAAPEDEPIKSITNGVHVSTWLGHDLRQLFNRSLGHDWPEHTADADYWQAVDRIDDTELWEAHCDQKQELVKLVRSRLVSQWARHGKSPDEMREISRILDPNALTIGFARRFATYKRAVLIFQDFQRLRSIITDPKRPVQIIFSGKAHPADGPGQDLVRRIVNIAYESELRGHVVFLEDYEMRAARFLVQGVDVWLNTPRRPREASGTSGMKAGMNGALNLSISDGWWPEAYNGKNGWLINEGREHDNEELQDYEDSSSFYDLLQNQVVPLYYDERREGVPVKWVEGMKECMKTVIPGFSSARQIHDYTREFYIPAAESVAQV
ncbi:MAG: alpha-glucan family phosphorylase, partial [Verrucomicrobiota bacterium]